MSTGPTSLGMIRRVFHVVSPTCEEMSELISALLDRELPLWTRSRMRLHFLYCRYCRRFREHLALVRRAAALLDASPAPGFENDLANSPKEELRRLLREDS